NWKRLRDIKHQLVGPTQPIYLALVTTSQEDSSSESEAEINVNISREKKRTNEAQSLRHIVLCLHRGDHNRPPKTQRFASSGYKKVSSKTLDSEDNESENEETINEPMEIDFIQKKEPATDDIAERLKLNIDTREKHDLRGIATVPTESLGIVHKYDYDLLASKRELKLSFLNRVYKSSFNFAPPFSEIEFSSLHE
ncbi:10431_t:CDS:2, partial [Paraglomus brasilianum]